MHTMFNARKSFYYHQDEDEYFEDSLDENGKISKLEYD